MKTKNAAQLRIAASASAWSLLGLVFAALIVAAGSMADWIPTWLNVTAGSGFFAVWALTVGSAALDAYADALQEMEEM